PRSGWGPEAVPAEAPGGRAWRPADQGPEPELRRPGVEPPPVGADRQPGVVATGLAEQLIGGPEVARHEPVECSGEEGLAEERSEVEADGPAQPRRDLGPDGVDRVPQAPDPVALPEQPADQALARGPDP